jgi:hypothetical protein
VDYFVEREREKNGNNKRKVEIMYASVNFKSKKAFREAVAAGKRITIYAPGMGSPVDNGRDFVEGPWFPEPHKWYAQVEMKDGVVVKVK